MIFKLLCVDKTESIMTKEKKKEKNYFLNLNIKATQALLEGALCWTQV